MNKLISVILCFLIVLTGCSTNKESSINDKNEESADVNGTEDLNEDFYDDLPDVDLNLLSQEEMNQFISDTALAEMEYRLESDEYKLESVDVVYLSKEYVDELEYNSKENVFFGYTLSELDQQFAGQKYIFTLGENGETIVKVIENNDKYLETVIKNVAIGAGVIVVLITVSVVTSGAGTAPVVQVLHGICVAGAQKGLLGAALGTCIGGIGSGIAEYAKTGDTSRIAESMLVGASYGFEIGAISGAAIGVGTKSYDLYKASKSILDPYKAEQVAADFYKGEMQKAFKNGVEVSVSETGHTRPDVIRTIGDTIEAIEVKTYDLSTKTNRYNLCHELKRQISQRINDLPNGSLQRIALNVQGRGYSKDFIEKIVKMIRISVNQYYPNIPIDVFDYFGVVSY